MGRGSDNEASEGASRSLLDPTGNEDAERAAVADAPRPGRLHENDRWLETPERWSSLYRYELDESIRRTLTQDETDRLIRHELVLRAAPDERGEMIRIVGEPQEVLVESTRYPERQVVAYRQRGGIDSDPLVRMIAFRAWGDRDRRWFEDRGVRSGDPIAIVGASGHIGAIGEIAAAWPGEHIVGTAAYDAWPGSSLDVMDCALTGEQFARAWLRAGYRVSARPRLQPGTAASDTPSFRDGVTPRAARP